MVARDSSAPATHRKKLSSAALRAMWQSSPTPEVRDLLWEIKCLQVVIMRARQLEQSLPPGEGTTDTGLILGALRGELAAESWLPEWEFEVDTCGKMPPRRMPTKIHRFLGMGRSAMCTNYSSVTVERMRALLGLAPPPEPLSQGEPSVVMLAHIAAKES